jgi:ELWxxDGT repeat protein
MRNTRFFGAQPVVSCAANWKNFMLCCGFAIALHGYGQVELVKDINTHLGVGTVADNEYSQLTGAGPYLYYVVFGNQLWRTATAGYSASLIKEVDSISNLTNVNGVLFFTAGTADQGMELWKSNGTAATTVMVKDIRAGARGSSPSWLTNVGGTLFFVANDGTTGSELWKSDGTTTGTVRVRDIMLLGGSSNPSNLIASNGLLYFVANDGKTGYEIWKSNGTSAGTQLIKDIRTEYRIGSSPQQLTDVNGTVFFVAAKPTGERRLFKTDGTDAGTKLVSDVPRNLKYLTAVGGTLFFSGTDTAHGEELWKSNGTAAGTVLVKDLTPGPGSDGNYGILHLESFASLGNKLYFLGTTTAGQGLWVSDGTETGTIPLTDVEEISFTFIQHHIIPFSGYIYSVGYAYVDNYNSLIRTKDTPESTKIFVENYSFSFEDNPRPAVANNFLYYISYGNLWKTDGTNKYVVRSPFTTTESSSPEEITDVNGIAYFGANDGKYGLWKSDGTRSGTALIKHFDGPIRQLTPSGNYLYYMAKALSTTSPTYYKLWRTELSTGNTRALSNINPNADDDITEMVDANGTLFFSGTSQDSLPQLWKTAGEPANTTPVRTFNNPAAPVIHLTAAGNNVFFATSSQTSSNDALWKSDGTAVNTRMIKIFNTVASARRGITQMLRVNQTVFFIGYNGYDYELWKTDGTSSGTFRVKDIRSGDQDVMDIRQLTNIDNTLYFVAAGAKDQWGQYERNVWKSNGTGTGTVKVASFPGLFATATMDDIFILGGVNGSVIVGLLTSYFDSEVWKTNGTEVGTQMLASLPTDQFLESTVINGVLYFTPSIADLYRTDGTVCGTYWVIGHAQLGDITYSNGRILLAYHSQAVGRELFRLIPAPSGCEALVQSASLDEISEDFANEEKVISYPNPFASEFSLRVNGDHGESYEATIIDARGMHHGNGMQLESNMTYNLGSELTPGLYILIIEKPHERIVKKILKSP